MLWFIFLIYGLYEIKCQRHQRREAIKQRQNIRDKRQAARNNDSLGGTKRRVTQKRAEETKLRYSLRTDGGADRQMEGRQTERNRQTERQTTKQAGWIHKSSRRQAG